jgi:hypothetical protein
MTNQEDTMKTKQMLLAALMMFAAAEFVHAQTLYPALKKCTAEARVRIDRNFGRALSLENEGVVESALSLVTKMKLDLPGEEFPIVLSRVRYLAANSKVPKLRYMACLAEAVFYHPERYKDAPIGDRSDNETFFSALDNGTDTQDMKSH